MLGDPSSMGGAAALLYWIPLGAGGVGFVRFNGRVYERIQARRESRRPQHLYHTALELYLGGARWVIENAWPSPDSNTASRGVVVEGPVFHRRLAGLRPFRYEVRCWPEGVIADAEEAADGPQLLTRDPDQVRHLLGLVGSVPPLTWGRDQMDTGEMWNSNSVISWLLATGGLPVNDFRPPKDGRAPGWTTGIRVAGLSVAIDPVR